MIRGHQPERILVVQLRRLGDVLLTSAVLEDLHRAFPIAKVDFLVGEHAAPLLAHNPGIDETIVYDRERPLQMWRQIRRRRYDWVIDAQSSPRTAPLTLLSGARVRVGYHVRVWGKAYTHRLSRIGSATPRYAVRDRQALLELVGVPTRSARPRLFLTSEERRQGEALARAAGAPADVPRVGLVLSAGERGKEWPPSRFGELASLVEREGMVAVLFEMPGDAERVAAASGGSARGALVRVPALRDFLAVLATCRAFVSGDTGPAHMSTALDVPTVTIFGPSPPEAWAAPVTTVAVVRADRTGCAGCADNNWRVAHACMERLEADTVMAALRELLARTGPRTVTA